jgi:hypothetical protein
MTTEQEVLAKVLASLDHTVLAEREAELKLQGLSKARVLRESHLRSLPECLLLQQGLSKDRMETLWAQTGVWRHEGRVCP